MNQQEIEYLSSTQLLSEARREMLDTAMGGQETTCPCCNRYVKLYKRKLHTEMATFLCRLVREFEKEPRYYSTRELCPATTKSSTDGSYLVHWGLVEKKPAANSSGGKSGMYRPTYAGFEFAHNQSMVPSHIHILCGIIVGFSITKTTITKALGNKFRYDELMGRSKKECDADLWGENPPSEPMTGSQGESQPDHVFAIDEFVNDDAGLPRSGVVNALFRMAKNELIVKIDRGKYKKKS